VVACCWDWELADNPGVAFSTFAGADGARWLLSLVGLAAAAAIVVVALRFSAGRRWRLAALGLLLGGAVGNLVDRVRLGAVTDFVRWRLGDHRWPIFNVADVALVIGVAILLVAGARGTAVIPRHRVGGDVE
jgi:signal peptidase II